MGTPRRSMLARSSLVAVSAGSQVIFQAAAAVLKVAMEKKDSPEGETR